MIGFSNPTILINNVPITIKPGSFKFTDGLGDTKVRAMCAGGNAVITIHTEDVSTKVGKCEMELGITGDNRALVRSWKANTGANSIVATQPNAGFYVVFNFASMINDPNWDSSPEGWTKVEFHSDPSIQI